jgi:hypothetical protein
LAIGNGKINATTIQVSTWCSAIKLYRRMKQITSLLLMILLYDKKKLEQTSSLLIKSVEALIMH